MTGYSRRILFANGVTAVAAVGLLGGMLPGAGWVDRGLSLVACLIYANCIGGLMAFVMPRLACWWKFKSKTIAWAARLTAIAALTVSGCLIAGLVLIAIRLSPRDRYLDNLGASLWVSLLIATVATLTITAYETIRAELEATTVALRTKERDAAEARRLALEAQLASLESRVQPHFLFNTLNSIAALIRDDPAGAERMTERLATLLRSSLDRASGSLAPLDQELGIVRAYLDIERVRFGERLRWDVAVADGLGAALVPPLCLQTLVENSVKYAVASRREGGSIAVRAARSNGDLRLDVEDDGPGFHAGELPAGHGLALLRDRLAMTFGKDATLDVRSRPGCTTVTLQISSTLLG
jgi:two-component system, LytTR family, sensor histidine kinase AlgZ